jgi:predicted amidophosphoribosyltransferase
MRRTGFAPLLDRVVFGRAYRRVAGALTAFGALVLPSSCVLCGRWDTSLCRACLAASRSATAVPFRAEADTESLPDVQRIEGTPRRTTDGGCLPEADGADYGPLPVLAAGRYSRAVSVVLLAYKNHGHVDLVDPLAAALAGVLHEGTSMFANGRWSGCSRTGDGREPGRS